MATESICLNPLSFARLTKNPSSQFRKRRNLSCRIRRSQSGSICSKASDYQDYQSYAIPLRLLPAEEVKVSTANPSFTVRESRSLYKVKLQTSNVFGSGISDMNARVLFCLIDDKGDSVLQTIPATLSSNDESFKFQRGSVDEFTFLGPELGKIRAVWISLESGQWRVGGVSLWVVKGPVPGETNVKEAYSYRYDFEVDELLLGESSDLSMVELRPTRITELTDSDQISSSSAPPNIGSTVVSNEESMEEYANLKLSLLLYDALLILLGSSLVSFSLGGNSAVAFFFGGTVGFLYLLLLQRSVDELQAPGSLSSLSENTNQILTGRLKVPVLSLALAVGLSVLAVRGYTGEGATTFAVTPREILLGTLGFLVCKVAVVLAAFKPLKDGS
ncbi:BnaC03g70420D [Brassica napus]|uniref:BnaC03g70420D protein n=1 Tax=Brassica napus TaxID=3708 RepID=A0A078FC59_BRANA|nr:BnaC03g70420D [Brassica napus]